MRLILLGVEDPASGATVMVIWLADVGGVEDPSFEDKKGNTEDEFIGAEVGVAGADVDMHKDESSCSGSVRH